MGTHFDAFDAEAEKLMLRKGIKASQLHKRLRDITRAASQGLPQVLYCNSYGEYGYSEAFESFIQEKQARPDSLFARCALQSVKCFNYDRIRDVQSITQFGQHVMEKWPGIAKLGMAYMRKDLERRIANIRIIDQNQKILLKMSRMHGSIVAETGRSDGQVEWDNHFYYERSHDFSMYAPSALETMSKALDATQNALNAAIQKERIM